MSDLASLAVYFVMKNDFLKITNPWILVTFAILIIQHFLCLNISLLSLLHRKKESLQQMPLHLHKKWPHSFGFEIYGNGPCFVTSVEKGSVAHKAGLLPGDQLLEINGQDVTKMSVEQIRALVKTESNHPPELEVVSCIKTHVIKPDHPLGYGFRVLNKRPVSVESVDYGGPAYQSGLRVGELFIIFLMYLTCISN